MQLPSKEVQPLCYDFDFMTLRFFVFGNHGITFDALKNEDILLQD